jgi:cytochrome c553
LSARCPDCPSAPGFIDSSGRTCRAAQNNDTEAKLPDAPNLAAQPASCLERELRACRAGTRSSEVMGAAAKELGDNDIRDRDRSDGRSAVMHS